MHIIREKIIIKIILILATVVITASAISVFFFSMSNTETFGNILKETILNLSQLTQISYSTPLWNMDRSSLAEMNLAILSNPNIIAVNVHQEYGFLTGLKKDLSTMKIVPTPLDNPFTINKADKEFKKVSVDIVFQGKKAGKVDLFYTEHLISKEIFKKNNSVASYFIFIAMSMIIVIFLLVKRTLINPVLALANVSKRISDSRDYSIRVEKKTDDEIGVLYDRFNDMVDNVETNARELSKVRNFLINIIESMPSMLISVDDQGIVTHWNHAAEIATGINASQILGKNIWTATDMFNDYKDSYKDIIVRREAVHFYRKKFEGHQVMYRNVSLYPLIDNGITGLVIRMDDVTEIESKEEQLRQAQKMETVGTLAGGLAHDFNNVLGGIIGTISIIEFKMKSGKNLPFHTLKDYIDTIKRSSQRAVEMVQQLLALSRKSEVNFVPVDLNMTIKDVMNICANTFDKSVELRQHPANEDAMINADPMQIEQVLLNLCVNSHHAMTIMRKENERPGGVLTVSVSKVFTDKLFCANHPEAKDEADYWILSIQDTGIGMDTKTIAKIFDPFFTTKDKGKGTGLGLAMVYNIIKLHNGFIDVYSEVGLGSTFSVYIPSMKGDVAISAVKADADLNKGQGTILVVDDEEIMRNLAQEILEECGYDVLIARDGQEGIDVFATEFKRINLVLLDMNMPKKSGREAYIEMKKIDPGLKVLLASGFRKDERTDEILSIGVQNFLQKPYTIDKLAEAVSKTMAS